MAFAAGVISSTLHQCLKFEYDHQEVVIHGEKGHPIYIVKGKKYLDGEIIHTLKLVGSIEGGQHNDALFITVQYEEKKIS